MRKDPKIPGKPTLDERLPRSKTAANELPLPDTKPWIPRRKALVVEAVLNGMITIEEVCRRYHLSVNGFMANSYRNAWCAGFAHHQAPDLPRFPPSLCERRR